MLRQTLRFSLRLLPILAALLFLSVTLRAQVPDPAITVQAPALGAGHNYIGAASETVNPADGSLSYDLPIGLPPGRQLSFPFGLQYASVENYSITSDQNGVANWRPVAAAPFQFYGWAYLLPSYSGQVYTRATYPDPNHFGSYVYCDATESYTIRIGGVQESLGIFNTWPDPSNPAPSCGQGSLSGGTEHFSVAPIGVASPPQVQPSLEAVDLSGTKYDFPSIALGYLGSNSSPSSWGVLATTITDKNGNQMKYTGSGSSQYGSSYGGTQLPTAAGGYTDTLGRQVISWTGLGGSSGDQVSIAGLAGNVIAKWQGVNVSFPETGYMFWGTSTCSLAATGAQPIQGLSEIDLPNGQKYSFSYDSTYGTVKQVTFPDGGHVRYQWGNYTHSSMIHLYWNNGQECYLIYDTPAITDRYVSFGGSEVLHQHFAYAPVTWLGTPGVQVPYWNTKQTTVTTTDLITGQISSVVYNYVPEVSAAFTVSPYGPPVESRILYQDASNHTMKTVNKTWASVYKLVGEQTILDNGQGITTLRCWGGNLVVGVYEYGFQQQGPKPSDPSCGSVPWSAGTTLSAGLNIAAMGPLLRQSATAFQHFATTPTFPLYNPLLDEPCKAVVYDGGGKLLSESDYLYDGGSIICGDAGSASTSGLAALPPGTHDETNYGPSASTARGNLTRKIERCFPLPPSTQPCADVVTTYAYDETGQVTSMVDGNGNAAGGNPSQHTTTYSYADSFSSGGPPSGNSNAFLTQITHPSTNGISHTENYSYDFAKGKLTLAKDQNGQSTSYQYNDPLSRLKQITYPDQGQTTFTYNDALPNPSVSQVKVMDGTGKQLTTTTVMDGMGHVIQSQLTSDLQGADLTDTTYDGLGRVRTQSNPHRSAPLSTDGISTHLYDALGRACLTVPQDLAQPPLSAVCPTTASLGSVFSSYAGNCTTVTDEAGKSRKSCSDALGRLAQVFEDPSGLNYETDYQYDVLGNLQSVTQKGGSVQANWRIRNFQYNSLSRLLNANNPESGTVSYSYDANGNLLTKTDARGVATTMAYDALNRVLSKTYSDGTPAANFYYDVAPAPWAPSVLNTNGRLVEATTGITPEP